MLTVMGAGRSWAEPPPSQEQEPARQSQHDALPADFISLKLEGACDDTNRRLWLINTHTYKSIATTVRWRADGGKDLTDRFFSGPGDLREIGCAAEAQILEAVFVEF
ncbi:hypothetical protein ACG33_00920 [Steroidobacter denitrificans]|uniref:Uncharacterized protein n=2 Tax=Steroidobacter denitrificans TaxID=465721 RepID=A0A127F810_STEDE|nr:hypothetical protein ACG33_00920 [Steroidobacter denitrificans]